jgi:hypothetical protein
MKAGLVGALRERLGSDLELEHVEVAQDPRGYRVSFEKIERALGFRASRTVPGAYEVIEAISSGVIGDFTEARYRN